MLTEIRIGNMNYKITEEEKPILNNQVCRGYIDYEEHKIVIDSKNQDRQNLIVTLLHEIVHGMLFENELHDLNTEENVEVISKALYQLLLDNTDLFKEETKEIIGKLKYNDEVIATY